MNTIPSYKRILLYILVFFIFCVTIFLRAYNMFGYPAYFDDEGNYMARAWAFSIHHQLDAYTYYYDHAPLGWIQLSFWAQIWGGFEKWGSAINTGRVLILLFTATSVLLTILILLQLRVSKFYALLGGILFAISPIAISQERMVFLDNIMLFWILLSIFLIFYGKSRIVYLIISAVSFGIGCLSKEVGLIFLIPTALLVFFTSIFHYRVQIRRLWIFYNTLNVFLWILISCTVFALWGFYAYSKGQFFPSSTHVSFLSTVQSQLARSGNGNIFLATSNIRTNIAIWGSSQFGDIVLFWGGLLAAIGNGISFFLSPIRRKAWYCIFPLYILLFFAFFGKGGQVYNFYIIPLLPFLAINIALFLDALSKGLTYIFHRFQYFHPAVIPILCTMVIILFDIIHVWDNVLYLETVHPTVAQEQAETWVQQHVPRSAIIVTDDYAYVDFQYMHFAPPSPVYFYKVDLDPAIKYGQLHNTWQSIQYILITPTMLSALPSLPLLQQAYEHSVQVQSFTKDGYTVSINKVIIKPQEAHNNSTSNNFLKT